MPFFGIQLCKAFEIATLSLNFSFLFTNLVGGENKRAILNLEYVLLHHFHLGRVWGHSSLVEFCDLNIEGLTVIALLF